MDQVALEAIIASAGVDAAARDFEERDGMVFFTLDTGAMRARLAFKADEEVIRAGLAGMTNLPMRIAVGSSGTEPPAPSASWALIDEPDAQVPLEPEPEEFVPPPPMEDELEAPKPTSRKRKK